MQRLIDLGLASAATVVLMASRTFALQLDQPPTTDEAEFLRWAIKEGGLFAVTLVILYFYRRDFKSAAASQQAQTNALLGVVQANITAMNAMKGTSQRLARAVEAQSGKRIRRDDDDEDTADDRGRG